MLTVGDKAHWTGEMTCQVAIDRNLGIPVEAFENYVPGHVEIMVDAIFGVGLSREVGGEFAGGDPFYAGAGAKGGSCG
ncbi:MAG: hypothetical protein ACLR8P_13005 [Clostridium fessum]